ncbi:MATH domain-containing protein [Ditylenchus destructor]|nr:MATH domain-containing protein [Ditylenchus destructor]
MYNLHKRNRPSDAENIDQIASAQNEDMEIKKAVAKVHCKETTIPRWNPTENIATDYEDFYKPHGSVELRIDRFTEFARSELHHKKQHKTQWSASTYIRGMPWKLCADIREKKDSNKPNGQSSDNERFLGLFLYCNKDSASTTWNCQAKYTFCVVAQKEGVDDFMTCKVRNFCCDRNYTERSHFISINTLLDPEKGFLKDDAIILRADVKAEKPYGTQEVQHPFVKTYNAAFGPVDKTQLFSSSTQLQSNFILVVQGKEVRIQTYYLSMHSQYFNAQFAKHKSVRKAVLQNIDHDEFIELLGVIYPTRGNSDSERPTLLKKQAKELARNRRVLAVYQQTSGCAASLEAVSGARGALLLYELWE